MHARTRRAALAKIHVGRKLMGLDEETYRTLLEGVTGSRSAGGLDAAGLSKALDEMTRLGAFGKPAKVRPRPDERRRPLLGKIYKLLDGRGPEYAEGILRHMFGDHAPERLEWATPEQLRKVVAALVYDRNRRMKKERTAAAAAGAGPMKESVERRLYRNYEVAADTIADRARRLTADLGAMPRIERRAVQTGSVDAGDARRALNRLAEVIADVLDEAAGENQEAFDA